MPGRPIRQRKTEVDIARAAEERMRDAREANQAEETEVDTGIHGIRHGLNDRAKIPKPRIFLH